MNTVVHTLSLDLHTIECNKEICVKQGDTSRVLAIRLNEDGKPYTISEDSTVTLRAKIPSGIVSETEANVEDNCIQKVLSSDMLASVGIVRCEVLITENDNQITSPTFSIVVSSTLS